MKYLLALLFTFTAYAQECTPWVPISRAEAIAAVTAYEQLADIPMKLCQDFPEEECICSEGDISASKLETRFIMDPDTGMVAKQYKVLVKDEQKSAQFAQVKEAKEQAEAQKAQAKALACQNLENSNIDSANTIAALRAIVKLMRECK
jgi:hypothetical protein